MKFINKTKGIMASIITSFAVAGLVASITASQTINFSRAEDVEYVLTLDGTNGAIVGTTGATETITAKTTERNDISFEATNWLKNDGYFGKCKYVDWDLFELYSSTLCNKNAIFGIKKIELINYAFNIPYAGFSNPEICQEFIFSWGWSDNQSSWLDSCEYKHETFSIDHPGVAQESYVFDFFGDCPDYFCFKSTSDYLLSCESIKITYSCLSSGIPSYYQGVYSYMEYGNYYVNNVNRGVEIIRYSSNNYSTIIIPDEMRNQNVVSLANQLFYQHSEITSVVLPSTLLALVSNVFAGTSISEMELPNGLIQLGAQNFQDCSNLTKIYLPNTVTKYGENVFKNIDTNVTIYTSFADENELRASIKSGFTLTMIFGHATIEYNKTVEDYRAA